MSPGKLHTFAMVMLLIVAGATIGGCASKSEPPPPPPAAPPPPPPPATLSQIKGELLAAKAQMDVTNASLNDLAKSSGPNAQANYDKFTTEFDKFKTLAEVCRTRNEDLKFRTQAYFDQWNKQAEISNPELRRRATEQRVQAENTFNGIKAEVELAKLSFDPYVKGLTDVSAYLKGNLTPAALASVNDSVTKANSDSKELSGHVDALVADINKIMASTGEAPAGRAPGRRAAEPAAASGSRSEIGWRGISSAAHRFPAVCVVDFPIRRARGERKTSSSHARPLHRPSGITYTSSPLNRYFRDPGGITGCVDGGDVKMCGSPPHGIT